MSKLNNCSTCYQYDSIDRRCRIGKANPRRKLDAVSVAETLGVQALCMFCEHREELVRHAHRLGPKVPIVGASTGAPKVEVEFIEVERSPNP